MDAQRHRRARRAGGLGPGGRAAGGLPAGGHAHITKDALDYLSGHLPYYREDLYPPFEIEDDRYYLAHELPAPPHGVQGPAPQLPRPAAAAGRVRHRLPLRAQRAGPGADAGPGFTQNDGHIYCTLDQARAEFLAVMRMHDELYRTLGIRDFDRAGAAGPGQHREVPRGRADVAGRRRITRDAIRSPVSPTSRTPAAPLTTGPGRLHVPHGAGQAVSASTDQVDLYTPSRFGLRYVDSDGAEKPVAVIHRAPLGSHERFVGFLTEHFGGAFPVWLAPERAGHPGHADVWDYAHEVRDAAFDAGLRVDVDACDARLPAKVRTAVTRKIPLILVVGRREAESASVTVRDRSGARPPWPSTPSSSVPRAWCAPRAWKAPVTCRPRVAPRRVSRRDPSCCPEHAEEVTRRSVDHVSGHLVVQKRVEPLADETTPVGSCQQEANSRRAVLRGLGAMSGC